MRVVDEDGDTAVGVEAQEPVLFLLVGHDVAVGEEWLVRCGVGLGMIEGGVNMGRDEAVHERLSPFCTVDIMELFEHDLHFLTIGRVHCDEVKTLFSLTLTFILSVKMNTIVPLHSSPPQVSPLHKVGETL